MKVVIPGGSGHIGKYLLQYFQEKQHDVKVLTRNTKQKDPFIFWDGQTLGEWQKVIDGSDVVINLAGRLVSCRPNKKNLKEMMDSRINSTRVIGEAISRAKRPPKLWIQMSTATIYAHSFDRANDEASGIIGGNESNVPYTWHHSVSIAKNWEKTLFKFKTPLTRKVAVRLAFMISPMKKGYFDTLLYLARRGMGGPVAGGRQYISWIHVTDFIRAIEFVISNEDINGSVNFSSPHPIPQKEAMSHIRSACGTKVYFSITRWMSEIGALFLKTDTQLVLKSRRVVPKKLLSSGFQFQFPHWPEAIKDIIGKCNKGRS